MEEEDALNHQQRHVVSNFVGSDDMRIEVGSFMELAERDTLIIASDGLTKSGARLLPIRF